MARKKRSTVNISISTQATKDGKSSLIATINLDESYLALPEMFSNHGLYPRLCDYLIVGIERLIESYKSGADSQLQRVKSTLKSDGERAE